MLYKEKASQQSEVSATVQEDLTDTHIDTLYLMSRLVKAADVNLPYRKIYLTTKL